MAGDEHAAQEQARRIAALALASLEDEALADALVGLTAAGLSGSALDRELRHVESNVDSVQQIGVIGAADDEAPTCFECLVVNGGELWAESFRRLSIWDADTLALRSLHDTEAPLDSEALALSSDGQYAAIAHGKRGASLWDARSKELLYLFEGHSEEVGAFCFSGEHHLISCSGDGTVRRWDTRSGEEVCRFNSTPMYCLALHPDETRIAVGGSAGRKGAVAVLDAQTLRLVSEVSVDISTQPIPPLSERGRRSAGVTARTRDSALVSALVWHSDGDHLLAGSWDRTLKLLQTSSSTLVREWSGHSHWVTTVALTPDARRVISGGGSDGKVIVWSLDASEPIEVLDLGAPIGGLCLGGGRLYVAIESEIRVFSLPRQARRA